jgi:dTDP-4-amino-4,6-dideoxygalactose transaminase
VISEADIEAVLDCLRSGWLTMGPRTRALGEALAERLGAHAIAVSSAPAAVHLALLAAGAGPGDEVLVPHAGETLLAAVERTGARAVVFGAEPERQIGARTRALIAERPDTALAVRDRCRASGVALIETGESVPHTPRGDFACLELFPGEPAGLLEGGLVLCAEGRHAARIRSLRSHAMTSGTWERHRGHADGYDVLEVGFNYRIDEPRAALALSRLARADGEPYTVR